MGGFATRLAIPLLDGREVSELDSTNKLMEEEIKERSKIMPGTLIIGYDVEGLIKEVREGWGKIYSDPEAVTGIFLTKASFLLKKYLNVDCIGLSGPYGYYRGLSDRPEILLILKVIAAVFSLPTGRMLT